MRAPDGPLYWLVPAGFFVLGLMIGVASTQTFAKAFAKPLADALVGAKPLDWVTALAPRGATVAAVRR